MAGAAEIQRWTVTWQSGLAQTMQLSLGGMFNEGPAQQNRVTLARSGAFKTGDALQFYGWSTTDLPTGSTDGDMGVRYRAPVRKFAGGSLVAGTGFEHWVFPSVLGGTRDLVADTYLGWSGGETIPVSVSANGKTLMKSDIGRGSFVAVQATHSRRLARWGATALVLQHGPAYVYSWNAYNRSGHRVLRYCATAQLSWKSWMVEGTFRPQAGLQPGIPDNRYWTVGIGRRFRF
jgi:hypothetical protein